MRMMGERTQQCEAHLHDGGGAARCPVQAPQQLLARRFGHREEVHEVFGVRQFGVPLGGRQNRGRIGIEPRGELLEEAEMRGVRESLVVLDRASGQPRAVGLALRGQQVVTGLHQPVEFALRQHPLCDIADRIKQVCHDVLLPNRVKYT